METVHVAGSFTVFLSRRCNKGSGPVADVRWSLEPSGRRESSTQIRSTIVDALAPDKVLGTHRRIHATRVFVQVSGMSRSPEAVVGPEELSTSRFDQGLGLTQERTGLGVPLVARFLDGGPRRGKILEGFASLAHT